MRRFRQPIIAGLVVLFFVVGGYIYTTHYTSGPSTSKRIDRRKRFISKDEG